jgi:predicted ABC-type ATPase
MASPLLYIVGGPNGAGKTTIANEFLQTAAEPFEYIGADLIAAELAPQNPAAAQIAARPRVHSPHATMLTTAAKLRA